MRKSRSATAAYHREWYARHRKQRVRQIKESNARIFARNQAFLKDYLSKHPCVDCGEADVEVLQFDHVRGTKTNDVSVLSRRYCSIETLKAEIAKCEVRCANDHIRVTNKRRRDKRLAGSNGTAVDL